MFFKLTDGNLTKIGPVAISTTGNAPNSSPGGATGNAVGEEWLDGRSAFSAPVLKVYDGSTWKAASGFTVNDTTGVFSLTRELQTRTYVGTGTGQYGYLQVNSGPVADESAITTPVAGMMRFDTTNNVMRAYNGTIWMNIGDMTGEDISCENLTVLGDTILGNDCGNDTLDVQAVSTFYCNVTIGTTNANDFIVNSESFFRSGVDLTLQSDLRFHAGNDTSTYVGFQAPSSIASNVVWTLPAADGSPGQFLATSGTGTLSWQTASGGGGGASVTVDDSAPLAPNLGDLWFDSSTGRLNVYYNESTMVPPVGADSQWVDASPASTGLADIRILDDLASSFNGATTTFTMQQGGTTVTAVSAQQLIIDLGGVIQRPATDYNVTGSQLTFTTPPQAGLTFSGRLLGNAMTLNAPASGSVTPPILDRAYVEKAGDTMTGDLTAPNLIATSNIQSTSQNGGQLAGLRNKIMNGDFRVIQRAQTATSIPGGSFYVADRWGLSTSGSSTLSSTTVSAGATIGTEQKNYLRAALTSGTFTSWFLFQGIEDVNNFSGKQITVSFYARGQASGDVSVSMAQNFGTSGSASVNVAGVNVTVGTSFTKHTVTLNVPSVIGKTLGAGNFIVLYLTPATLTPGYYLDITNVQVEEGPVATPFEERPIGLELSLCQRYYETLKGTNTQFINTTTGVSVLTLTTTRTWTVTKRISPTITLTNVTASSNLQNYQAVGNSTSWGLNGTVGPNLQAAILCDLNADAEL